MVLENKAGEKNEVLEGFGITPQMNVSFVIYDEQHNAAMHVAP